MFASTLVFRQSVWCPVAFEANLWLCSSARRDSTSPTLCTTKRSLGSTGYEKIKKNGAICDYK